MLFLTETDTKRINVINYRIKGYNTYVQASVEDNEMIRIIVLTKESCGVRVLLREDLMSSSFPSIWLEIQDNQKSKSLIGGFYRQWSANGIRSTQLQITEME